MTVAEGPRRTAGVPAPTPPKSLREFVDKSGLRSLVIGVSKDPNAKLTILLVQPGSGRPTLVVKAATTDHAARAIEAEMDILQGLRQLHPCRVLPTVPRVVDLLELDGRPAMVTTAIAGAPMSTSYLRWQEGVAQPLHLLAEFVGIDAEGDIDGKDDGDIHRRVLGGCRRGKRQAGEEDEKSGEDRETARLRANLVRRSAVHGDFWFGNLLTTGGRLSGVVDWEAGARVGEPVRDLVRFAVMYALYLDRRTRPGRRVRGHRQLRADEWGAGVEYALDREGWFPDLFRRFLCHGLSRLGAAPECWRDAALAGIAEVAAVTDDPEFSRRHLDLFRRLPELPQDERSPACLGSAT